MKVGKPTIFIICILCLFIIGFLAGSKFSKPVYKTKIDTVQKVIYIDKIVIKNAKGIVVKRTDTLIFHDTTVKEVIIEKEKYYAAKPYKQILDTVTKLNDSLFLAYYYPERTFMDIRVKPHNVYDTNYVITKTVSRPLWLDLTTHGAVAYLVYLLTPKR